MKKVPQHQCQWCKQTFPETTMELWNGKWQCKDKFGCSDRMHEDKPTDNEELVCSTCGTDIDNDHVYSCPKCETIFEFGFEDHPDRITNHECCNFRCKSKATFLCSDGFGNLLPYCRLHYQEFKTRTR